VGDPHLDAKSTRAPLTGLVDERDQAIAVLDDLLRLDPKVIEALEPGAQEALETGAPLVGAGLGAGRILLPLKIGMKQRAHF
jgi:hypothetical protein